MAHINSSHKKGNFPANGDLVLKDSRIYRNDDETKTPFEYTLMDGKAIIRVFQNDLHTGITITINL